MQAAFQLDDRVGIDLDRLKSWRGVWKYSRVALARCIDIARFLSGHGESNERGDSVIPRKALLRLLYQFSRGKRSEVLSSHLPACTCSFSTETAHSETNRQQMVAATSR